MSDLFSLLTRGTKIDRKGKHQNDVDLVSGRMEQKSSRAPIKVDYFQAKSTELDDSDDDESSLTSINTPEDAERYRKNKNISVTGDDIPFPAASFSILRERFNMDLNLLRNIQEKGFTEPSPIQAEVFPLFLQDRDLIACAPTGSGKTVAFAVPLIQQIKPSKKGLQCLIISPTKELATQIYDEIMSLAKGVNNNLKICILNKQQAGKIRNKQKQNFDIMVTTPLRLIEMIEDIDLSKVTRLIFDEADKLFDRTFIEQTDVLLSACTSTKLQKSMFSATIPQNVEEAARSIMHSPVEIIVGQKRAAASTIDQKVTYCGTEEGKLIAIRQMVTDGEIHPPAIVFVQSIQRAKALFHELLYDGVNVDVIHGERSQTQRNEIIERFKQGDIWVLICTDVLSRGIDFKGVNLVINYDVPQTPEAYVHRIGRTGRAGRSGRAVTFYTDDDKEAIKLVIDVMKQSGCEVQEWMTKLKKISKSDRSNLKKRAVKRDDISTVPKVVKKKKRQREEMINASKKRKAQAV